jgi:malonate transporter and related proteins
MLSALSGFALIGVLVAVGWAVRRWGGMPADADAVLGRLGYAVLNPCLLFTGVADADLRVLFSEPLLVSAAAACTCFGVHLLCTRGRERGTRIAGSLSAGYVNANYIGIPVATYVLGDAALVVPIIMVQLLVMTPVALTLLETATTGHASVRTTLRAAATNPMIVAVLLGAGVALSGRRLPHVLAEPLLLIGHAAVPVVLIAFGMTLSGRRVLAAGPDRVPAAVAVALKTAGMPAVAFLLALACGLERAETYAVTVLAGLPTAQNVFLYAQRFSAGVTLVRDVVFLSTVGCAAVLLVIALLFAGAPR